MSQQEKLKEAFQDERQAWGRATSTWARADYDPAAHAEWLRSVARVNAVARQVASEIVISSRRLLVKEPGRPG
jgi:hypothetical protein